MVITIKLIKLRVYIWFLHGLRVGFKEPTQQRIDTLNGDNALLIIVNLFYFELFLNEPHFIKYPFIFHMFVIVRLR